MKDLKENLFGKHGFIYKIEAKYYYLGMLIFKTCSFDVDIDKYNKFIEALNNKDDEKIKYWYKKVRLSSEAEREKDEKKYPNLKIEFDKFIDSLDAEQYKQLESQVKILEKTYNQYVYKNSGISLGTL